jgi:SPP1 family predicted phage head-tail adaptor
MKPKTKQYRYRVTFKQKAEVEQDSYGRNIAELETVETRWANVTQTAADENITQDQIQVEADYRIDMRLWEDADETMIAFHNDKQLGIVSVVHDFEQQTTTLLAKTKGA